MNQLQWTMHASTEKYRVTAPRAMIGKIRLGRPLLRESTQRKYQHIGTTRKAKKQITFGADRRELIPSTDTPHSAAVPHAAALATRTGAPSHPNRWACCKRWGSTDR